MSKLSEVITTYSSNQEIIGKDLITSLIEDEIETYDLSKYISNLKFNYESIQNIQTYRLASYCMSNMELTINLDQMQKYISAKTFNNKEEYYYSNLLFIQMLLHEFEHIKQLKMHREGKNTAEKKIIDVELEDVLYLNKSIIETLYNRGLSYDEIEYYLKNRIFMKNKYYDFNPLERMAQIKSFGQCVKLVSEIEESLPKTRRIFEFNLYKNRLSNYNLDGDSVSNPTDVYFEKLNCKRYFSFKEKNKEVLESLPLARRLYLGLPISCEEYNEQKKLIYRP